MSNSKSNINEYGLITNTISKGMGMNFLSVLSEKIDNSLDANAKNIEIIIDHKKIKYNFQGENKVIKGDVLIISDDGDGMCEKDSSLASLISLFKINENYEGNGIYGIGSIASDLAIGYKDNIFNDKLTLYFTKSNKIDQDYEVVIPWFNILGNKDEKNVWTSKVSSNNISNTNSKLFNLLRKNRKSGTTVINIFNDSFVKNFNIKEISYFIKKTYYSYLKTGVHIVIKNKTLKNELVEICDKTNLIDILSLQLIKKDKTKGCYIETKVKAYYDIESDKYGFKIIIGNYNLGKTKLDFKIQTLKSIAKDQNPTTLSGDDSFEDFQYLGDYNFTITLVNGDIIQQDSMIMKDHVNKSDASEYTGLYFNRNLRILTSPMRLEYNRTTQDGTHWRSCLSWTNNKKLDALIKPQLNKSQLNLEDINRTLYRTLSLFLKQFYRSFYKNIIESKKSVKEWDYKNKESKKISKKVSVKVKKVFHKTIPSKKKSVNVKIRKAFNLTQVNEVLVNQTSKCNLLDVELDKIFMPYDKDHIDNDSSNNSTENLQLLSMIAHRLKTNYYENDKKDGYKLIKNDPGYFIAKMINSLSKSKYFINYMNSKKISINTNQSSMINGLLNLNSNDKNIEI